MNNSDVQDLSKVSVGKLVSRLTPGQLWKIGGALIVLLSGSFYFGYWISSNIYQTKISKITADLDSIKTKNSKIEEKLRDRENRIQLLHLKELLLGKIVLYRHYQAEAQREGTSEVRKLYKDTGDDLIDYVNDLKKKTIDGEAKPTSEIHISKGIVPSLTFEFDKATVPLPRELFQILY
jgi:hypothetical protein